jgi:peptide/nickel transport system substrate-binding protein
MTRALALAALLLACSACTRDVDSATEANARGSTGHPVDGDTFIRPLIGNISGLIPNITSDANSHEVGGLLYNGLVTFDRDQRPIGDLAESWQQSGDCRQLTFKLRHGVQWHDGHPFTADDVAFTYRTMIDPKTPTAYKDDFEAIERLETPDPYTVRITYAQPHARSLMSWGMEILPRHLLEPWVRKGKLREAPQNWNQPVGTGPYKLSQMWPGEKLVLVANTDYFEGPPHLSRVVFRVIPSQATVFLELKAKGLDSAPLSGGLTALQYARQTDYPAFRKDYHKYRYPSNSYTYLGFNLKNPLFADRRVRQAIALAIDKKALIEGVVLGLAREATGPYKPGSWQYNASVTTYPFDQARARALLAEAGWKETNADGVLVRDGKPFAFELLTNQGNDERKKIAEIVQASLREVGIAVEIRVIEWASLLKEYIKKRHFDADILGWNIAPDPDQFPIWHSSRMGPDDLNTVSYANPEVDALLERGRQTCVQAERKRYYDRFQEILAEDQPYVFLYFRDALPVVSSRVRGVLPGSAGIDYNFHDWWVPRSEQRYTSE